MPGLNPLVDKIRGLHPGAYDDMDDATLTKQVLAKYPQYSDLAAPPAAGPHVDMQAHDLLGPVGKDHLPSIGETAGDLAGGILKNTAQVSTPGIIASLMKKFSPGAAAHLPDVVTKNATPAEELPSQVMQTGLMTLAGGLENPEAGWQPTRGAVASAMAPAEESAGGMGSRVVEVAKRRAGHLPGVQAVKDVDYVVRGSKAKPAAPAGLSSNAEGVPSGWPSPSPELVQAQGLMEGGKTVADPAAGLGSIPVRGSIAEKMTAPTNAEPSPIAETPAAQQSAATPPAPKPSPRPIARGTLNKMMDSELGKALGAKQLDPKVPLRGQMAARMPQESEAAIPEGHTPVESSALRSYKYDAAAREFHARATSGNTVYVYGDVAPEDAAAFEKATSKGQAWGAIRRNPLVAKIVDGKRVAVKAGVASSQ